MSNTMKPMTLTILLSLATGPALADKDYYDYAQVISTNPVYERTNTPKQECWSEKVGETTSSGGSKSYTGAVIGGIAGGLLGSQVGKGSGKTAATAAGAITGALVGDNIDNRGGTQAASQPVYQERCRTVDNWSRQLTGYDVTYRYNGRNFTTFMSRDPGKRIRVIVDVRPAEND